MPKSKWGIPAHVNEDELIPDATRSDHYVWPHPSGNPSLDEVYHMPANFAVSRSAEDDEAALEMAVQTRKFSSKAEADAIIAEATARAAAIVAEAEGQARALKSRGTSTPAEDDEEDEIAPRGKRGRRPPPSNPDAPMYATLSGETDDEDSTE